LNELNRIRFDDQTVVITGAGGGLGREYALLMAARGANVVVNDLGGSLHGSGDGHGPADQVVAEIQQAGGTAVASYDSVATPEGGKAIITTALQEFGRIDALVHNAGILRDKSFLKLTPADVEDVLDVHLKAAFWLCQPAFAAMKEQSYGRFVLTTSSSGLFGNFGQANYGAAKTGLLGLMRVLSIEGARYGILANCVSPSASTRMTEELLGPLAEHLSPQQVAPLVAYLSSRNCDFTSEIISAGGGRFARVFLGLAPGWYGGKKPVSPEDLADHIEDIFNPGEYTLPKTSMDEAEVLLAMLNLGDIKLPG
jgi:NAD(P)-dependent dehydrogenase (short-subunit alcohol dehydrogenase family)